MKKLLIVSGITLSLILTPSCKKKPEVPFLLTTVVTEISTTSALSGGRIINDGGAPIAAQGVCWATTPDPTIEDAKTTEKSELLTFTSNITQVSPGTTYYVRAYATNSAGTGYGKSESFNTLGQLAVINIQAISNLQMRAVTLNLTLDPKHLATLIVVEWGTTTSYGNTLTPSQSPVAGSNPVNVSADLTGLTPGTTYHYRIVAKNELGTIASEDMIFTTLAPISDIDGNTYNIRTLGKQVWMTENLKVTRYRNGDPVQHITNGSTWDQLTQGAYCNYNNDINNVTTYGRLYNGYAVLDNRGICPSGWHVPGSNEFEELQTWIGDVLNGGKLKDAGTVHWKSPNTGATNESGFTGLPGGKRMGHIYGSDGFDGIGIAALFWQKEITSTAGHWWVLVNYSGIFDQGTYSYPNFDALIFGCSIRCIKD